MIELSNSSELQVWCEVDVRRAQENFAFHLSLILVTSFVLGECFYRKALLSLQRNCTLWDVVPLHKAFCNAIIIVQERGEEKLAFICTTLFILMILDSLISHNFYFLMPSIQD